MKNFERLQLLLRPPGCGIPTLVTGQYHAAPVHRYLFGSDQAEEVDRRWKTSFEQICDAKCILIGIPSDTGAGLLRGSSFGPIGIRSAYFRQFGSYPVGVFDIGDVLCIPHLLHDEMLSTGQIKATRTVLYPTDEQSLPVSPLSIAEVAFDSISTLNPTASIVMLGGDHGVLWPVLKSLASHRDDFAVLQLDAHTDIAKSRFGVKHCYSTWAYHAMSLLKPHRLVQVGVRASSKSKKQWISEYPFMQFRAEEVHACEEGVIEGVIEYLKHHRIESVYITNDIDATDVKFAPATGTPEPNGLSPDFIRRLIETVSNRFRIVGADIVEVAPPLSGIGDYSKESTCQTAADYLRMVLNCIVSTGTE